MEDLLIMDVRDVRGSNNQEFGTQQCVHEENPHRNGVNSRLEDAFVESLDTHSAVIKEKPIHRTMLFMFARGDSDVQVAEATGYSTCQVSNIRRTPWMQAKIATEIRNAGEKDVKELLASMGPDCLQGIYELAKDPQAKAEVQLRARQDIVDRWIGKACQPTKDETKNNLEELPDEVLQKIAKGES